MRTKTLLIVAMVFLSLLPQTAKASYVTFTIDGISYTLYYDGYEGHYAYAYNPSGTSFSGAANILPNVSYTSYGRTITAPVTSVTGFENCTGLTSISIPNSVTSIGSFKGCSSLTHISMPNSLSIPVLPSFEGCSSLTSISIPHGVTALSSFKNCSSLTSISIPDGVESLGSFEGCSSLTSISIPNSVTSLSSFARCSSLTSISIPDGVTALPSFSGCTSLSSITFSDNVKSLGSFGGCKSLTSFTIPEKVTGLGDFADSGLTQITIPESITHVSSHAFARCLNLTTVYWNARHVDDLENDNKRPYDPEYSIWAGTPVKTIIIGENVEYIGNNIFFSHFMHIPGVGVTYVEKVIFKTITPPEGYGFCCHPTVYVPAGSLQAYQNHPVWGYYFRDVTPGDVNGDGGLGIDDVSNLIDNLLMDNSMYNPGADVNGDGRLNIEDVTALIDKLLFEN